MGVDFLDFLVIIAIYPCHRQPARKVRASKCIPEPSKDIPLNHLPIRPRSFGRTSGCHMASPSLVTSLAVRARRAPHPLTTRDGRCMRALRHRSPRRCPLDSMNLFVNCKARPARCAAQRMYVRRLPAVALARAAACALDLAGLGARLWTSPCS